MSNERSDYWNKNYMTYWKSRVDEAKTSGESLIISGDSKTEDDRIYEEIFRQHPFTPGNILDVGCAWGRMFGLLKKFNLQIYGADISSAMITEARKNWADDVMVKDLRVEEAEKLSFQENTFDNVACLAVFDATYQHEALEKYFQVLRPGGLLYLTGKNDNYLDDDDKALQAEIGARGKGHPNYFTDLPSLLKQVRAQGHELVAEYYFERRGDFGDLKYSLTQPAAFYEYFIILKKKTKAAKFQSFSDSHSKTFRRQR